MTVSGCYLQQIFCIFDCFEFHMRTRLQLANRERDLSLFNLAVDSKLCGCDLVSLRVNEIHLGDAERLRATVCQRKTGRPMPFEIDLTGWLWTGLIERISLDQRSWERSEDGSRTRSRSC